MTAIAYSVFATLPDEGTASEYTAWLASGHVDAVTRAGAGTAMIIRYEDPATPILVESRYIFPTRQAFDQYIRDHAPALRAEGLKRFPSSRGIQFTRRIGTVL